MSFASLVLRKTTFRLIKNQLYIVLVVAILSFILYDLHVLLSTSYGGFIAIVATLISSWGISRTQNIDSVGKQQASIELYLGAVQKYVIVLLLFALGMGLMHLPALPMIVSFALGQIAYLFIVVNTNFTKKT